LFFVFENKKYPSLFILIIELNLEDLDELMIDILKEHIQKGKINKFKNAVNPEVLIIKYLFINISN
jgi:hypothetical protein